ARELAADLRIIDRELRGILWCMLRPLVDPQQPTELLEDMLAIEGKREIHDCFPTPIFRRSSSRARPIFWYSLSGASPGRAPAAASRMARPINARKPTGRKSSPAARRSTKAWPMISQVFPAAALVP